MLSQGVCALQRSRELRGKNIKPLLFKVNIKCTGCKECLHLGCPAIGFDIAKKNAADKMGAAFIDPLQCTGCGLCAQEEVCLFNAHDKEGETIF